MPPRGTQNPEDENLQNAGVVDPAARAARGLEAMLAEEGTSGDGEIVILDEQLRKAEEIKRAEAAEKAATEAALIAEAEAAETAPPVPPPSDRKKLRMVLVTTDISFFIEGSKSQLDYLEVADRFDEIHVIVINLNREALPESLRVALNMWVYSTNSRSYAFGILNAYSVAKRQLVLSTVGFRGDIVIAGDAFESAAAAYLIARKYSVPLQVQVLTDPFEEGFVKEEEGNNWRLMAAKFVIPRAACIFVRSSRIQGNIERRYRKIKDKITFLPPFRDLMAFRDGEVLFNLHERYPQFKFIMLAVTPLDARSKVDFIIDVCAPYLQQYPTLGLIIVGEGPEHERLTEKIAALGITEKVSIQPERDDLVSYMKTANLLVNVSTSDEQDLLVAAAAAAGLPILTVEGDMSTALFEDGVNAFVCPLDDVMCFQSRIREFLNNNQLRTAFAINGKNKVFSVVEQDVSAYRRAFVDVVEACVLDAYGTKPVEEQKQA